MDWFILGICVLLVLVFFLCLPNIDKNEYYVRYPDGERTGLMSRHMAQNYRDVFGGKVYKKGEKK